MSVLLLFQGRRPAPHKADYNKLVEETLASRRQDSQHSVPTVATRHF